MEKKCKKCGTTENVNFDGMCKKCYEDSIIINEVKEDTENKKKGFWKDKKNIAITIFSIFVVILVLAYPTDENSTNTVKTSSTVLNESLEQRITTLSDDLKEANQKIKTLEENNKTLSKEKEDLTAKLNSMPSTEELQKTIEEKSNYIFNLEAQVGTLTAEKSQAEAQVGILQQQIDNVQKSNSTSATTTSKNTKSTLESNTDTSVTVYITDTGNKYHRGNCSYLRSSKHSISKNSAISQGYTACSRCNP